MKSDAFGDPRIAALMSEVSAEPQGPRRMLLLEQAINIADSLGDPKAGWNLRQRLMNDAEMSGHGDRTIVAITWCLAMADRFPDLFRVQEVLWQFKWVVTTASCMSAVPREAALGVVDEMQDRFAKAGWGMRAVHHKRMCVYWSLGDLPEVQRCLELWQATPRDRGADCLACERDQMVEVRVLLDQTQRAIREARPLVEERQSCSHVPQRTFNKIVFPLWSLGRHKEALEMQRRGVKATRHGLEYLGSAATHMLFAACAGHIDEAGSILQRRLPECAKATDEVHRVEFLQHAAATIHALRILGHETLEHLHALRVLQIPEPTTRLDLWEAHLTALARDLGDRFDRRGGNSFRADSFKGLLAKAAQAPQIAAQAAQLAPLTPGRH